jgi:probable HAF family extracellular repeat protein
MTRRILAMLFVLRTQDIFNRLPGFLLVLALAATLARPAAAQTASFQSLGQMPGVWPAAGTYASALSGDGSTIMGYGWVCADGGTTCTSSDTVKGYRWTVVRGYQILTPIARSDFFGAGAVSYDGTVVVGENPQPNQFAGFRWTPANGLTTLPINIADAITADGAMVAGSDNWWKTSGQTGIFGPFPSQQDQTAAFGLSGTAQSPVAVGAAINGSDAFGATFNAFRWTPAGGLQDIGVPDIGSIATAISADGLVIVGEHQVSGFWRAFRWTASTGIVDIGTLGGPESAAFAVNKDGTVIVGASLTSGSTGSSQAFRWTAKTGMQDLQSLLKGTKASHWIVLSTANGVSADGTVIAGYGLSPKTSQFPFGQWTPFRVVLAVP